MTTDVAARPTDERRATEHPPPARPRTVWSWIALLIGAFAFLFPFYYMIIGSLQKEPDSGPSGAFPNPANLGLHNYAAIDSAISLGRSLVNSGIFTGGVIICTTVFGLLAGYALARLQFRGRGSTFALVLLVQVVPFQLLLIPLYVLIVRDYGLADSYLGMILPFAINTSAVFIFRQFFLQLPAAMFEAARMDGASELQILFRVALPLCKPAVLSVVLLSFTGPWNEFLWPFLVTKDQDMQPLAVSLANYISTVAAAAANPFGAILAGACVLAAPAVALYIIFQSRFNSTDIDSATKG
ncbi:MULTISPECIES: carbohydrate ABC transporter permease [Streptomyces]|uniref:Carbohydrate ABC transporter permease n=1 Tax=Streptomyces cadmiisoli TaxID=2184053 RepID=A0A2Z4J9K8_9ACTN|nr:MULTISPECIES: carbohydrate ABC transporter permease [Streptomyces]AWW41408.1 carbohydrate ABC transporter permease [Streptomyces cadmiisoli]